MKVLDDAFEILEYEHTAGERIGGGIDTVLIDGDSTCIFISM